MHGHRSPKAHRAQNVSNHLLLLLLSIAQLMVILDISAVNVALPDLAADLGLGRGDLGWTITSYSLVFGSLLLLGGRAADLLGRRRVFLTGLGVFTGSSLAAALAGDAAMLFAARAGQGLGAAMLSPAALSIITISFHGAERARALAVWGAVGGAGAAIGVLLGGALTELVSWRAIFFINLPVGALVAAGAMHIVPADRERARWTGLDLLGALLATAGIAGLVYALSQAETAGWTSVQTLGVGSAAVLVLSGFAALELRAATPLLRVQRLADRAVGGGFLMMLTASAVMFGSFLLASLYMQRVLGTGALETGLAFLPFAAVIGVGVHVAGRLIARFGVRIPMASGFAVAAGGLLLLSSVSADGSYVADVLPGMLVVGLGLGTILVSVTVSVLTGAADEESGMLSGLNTTGHEVGGSLGIAVLATIATGAAGIGDAFLIASAVAGIGSLVALIILPSARHFLPKLAVTPPIAVH